MYSGVQKSRCENASILHFSNFIDFFFIENYISASQFEQKVEINYISKVFTLYLFLITAAIELQELNKFT